MESTRLEEIARVLGVQLSAGMAHDTELTGLAYDSRHVKPGFLFIAIPGQKQDGTHFIDDAIKRGAVAVVGEAPLALRHLPYLRVPNAREAMARIACEFFGNPASALDMFGVTGTNGKTTTAFMLRALLASQNRSPGLISTVRYEMGERIIPANRTTPEAPDLQAMLQQMDRSGCDCVAMEVSSHALDQNRVLGIDFDAAIFTNLSRDHLDYHGTMESYSFAKQKLFRDLGHGAKSAVAILNADDPTTPDFAAAITSSRVRTWTYGYSETADLRALRTDASPMGSVTQITSPWGGAELRLPLLGRFNVLNALAALCALAARGAELSPLVQALVDLPAVPGRLERVSPGNHPFHVFIDYAHTDDALRNALAVLKDVATRRLLVVFGCGGDRDQSKRALMGAAAADLADRSWITTDNPRGEDPEQIAQAVTKGFSASDEYRIVLDRADAIEQAIAAAQPGDIVLIAGKGHETYQEFAHTVIPFDDAVVARRVLGVDR